jgi:putative oxidoreductase
LHVVSSRSDTDVAALMLRLAIGPMLIAHGTNKVAGSGGMEGTTRWFDALGLRPAKVHARLAASVEIGSGVLLTLGAFNPFPAAAIIGLMTTAGLTDHRGKGFFVFKGGWEYVGVVGVAAATVATMGHGRYSLDRLLGNRRHGLRWGAAAVALGLLNAGALLATSYRPPPPAG